MAPQIMPKWWFYLFSAFSCVSADPNALAHSQFGMGGLLYSALFRPHQMFMNAYPTGYDKITDMLLPGASKRIEASTMSTGAGESRLRLSLQEIPARLGSRAAFVFITLVETLMPLYLADLPAPYQKGRHRETHLPRPRLGRTCRTTSFSRRPHVARQAEMQIFVAGFCLYSQPREIILNPSKWNDNIMGCLVYVPIGSALKFLWIFGVGAKSDKAKKAQ